MERTAEGVRIHAPGGEVLLRLTPQGIEGSYEKGPLVNGSAAAYAQQIAREAVNLARQLDLPWSTDDAGHIVVNEPQRYYRESFSPELMAAETLLHWLARTKATLPLGIAASSNITAKNVISPKPSIPRT